jgi:hypothetical protein
MASGLAPERTKKIHKYNFLKHGNVQIFGNNSNIKITSTKKFRGGWVWEMLATIQFRITSSRLYAKLKYTPNCNINFFHMGVKRDLSP